MPTITPFLWFDTQAEEAMNFYASIFRRSKIVSVNRAHRKVMSVQFELEGQRFMALNGGPMVTFTKATSLQIVPNALGRLLGDMDGSKSARVMEAMLQMNKLDLDRLQRACDGT